MNPLQFLLSAIPILSLAACAQPLLLMGQTEHFAVAAWNASNEELEQVRVIDAGNRNMWWFSQSGQNPHPRWPRIPQSQAPGFGGNRHDGRIPDAVTVQWRELPPAGERPYTGTPHGPFLIHNIRSRIPADILRQARKKDHVLNITFSAGIEPVQFDWKLKYYNHEESRIDELAQGGDSIGKPPIAPQ